MFVTESEESAICGPVPKRMEIKHPINTIMFGFITSDDDVMPAMILRTRSQSLQRGIHQVYGGDCAALA